MSKAGNAAAAYAALRTAAAVADHWVQTSHQAAHKADEGLDGHKAMAGHIASYAGAQAVALAAANHLLGMKLRPSRMAAAVASARPPTGSLTGAGRSAAVRRHGQAWVPRPGRTAGRGLCA